ncbi:hepatitis A virus cellular receptor 1 homolog [Oreochromis niloticus]|uniref:hepatitis A virus cellular receptor 1 homolog n=1 Tax=Oreochromis niloticus TaxID=8128 RepID=UPI00025FC71F|nr:hepatitis A virus cellular receptor 1 homolog [Oreochromis niloticus]
MKLTLLLALLTVCECDSSRVKGHTGQDVTLPCKYDRKYHGAVEVCWQRGEIPINKCSNQLISTDGDKVLTRASSRYQLLGRLEDGDVSLTIKSLTEGDAGRYGCRVEIPGPFNDEKLYIDLTVVPAPQIHTSTASTTKTTAASQTEGHLTSTESLLTSSHSVTSGSKKQEGGALTGVMFYVLLGSVLLLIVAGGLKLLCRRPQKFQQFDTSARFSSTSSAVQLHSESSTGDGVYHISGSEGVYENYLCSSEAPPTQLPRLKMK